jgi:arylsulfatase
MTFKSKKILQILIFLGVLFALPLSDALSEDLTTPLEQTLRDMSVAMPGADNFIVLKDFSRGDKKRSFRSITAQHGQDIIKIEATGDLDKAYVAKLIDEKSNMIKAMFNRIPSAYPGMITNTIEIPEKYKPVTEFLNDDPDKPVMLLYSTARFTYGASAEDLIKFRSALIFNYCERTQTLYRIEYFTPKDSFDKSKIFETLLSFSCDGSNQQQPPAKETAELGTSYQCQDCNIIFLGWEPLGANHLKLYGYTKQTSPRLDRFAEKSIVFKNAVSVSSWTLPVFMSMFTSMYPSEHKLVNKFSAYNESTQTLSDLRKLSPDTVTLAEVLKKNGYTTGGFTGGAAVGKEFGYGLGFDRYEDKFVFGGFDDVFPRALKWIKKNKDKKFFAFILGYDVHGRYPLPVDHTKKFLDPHYNGRFRGTADEYWKLRNDSIDLGELDLTDSDIKFWRDWYDTKIFESDKRFGEFLDQLSKTIDLNKTVFVITSASGNEFYEHKIFDHGHGLYDELIRVPLIIHIPRQKPAQVTGQVRVIDIMPTILKVLGIPQDDKVEGQLRGVDLIPLMQGEHKELFAFSETDYLLQSFKRSVRSPDGWKFIYSMDTEERELYNINQDPLEEKNLISEEPTIAYRLEEKLFDWLKGMGQDSESYNRLIGHVINSD